MQPTYLPHCRTQQQTDHLISLGVPPTPSHRLQLPSRPPFSIPLTLPVSHSRSLSLTYPFPFLSPLFPSSPFPSPPLPPSTPSMISRGSLIIIAVHYQARAPRVRNGAKPSGPGGPHSRRNTGPYSKRSDELLSDPESSPKRDSSSGRESVEYVSISCHYPLCVSRQKGPSQSASDTGVSSSFEQESASFENKSDSSLALPSRLSPDKQTSAREKKTTAGDRSPHTHAITHKSPREKKNDQISNSSELEGEREEKKNPASRREQHFPPTDASRRRRS